MVTFQYVGQSCCPYPFMFVIDELMVCKLMEANPVQMVCGFVNLITQQGWFCDNNLSLGDDRHDLRMRGVDKF